jgi:hypothetical protein
MWHGLDYSGSVLGPVKAVVNMVMNLWIPYNFKKS